ncbi:hypothetical protein AALO_G00029580 [Alosa alosa]|uniref:Uncharacterized protein n=1 Tax=Alosa alosa TaxID=278164 RepID=A0AAV6HBF7_9TELE|nr:hypothetical protein AALO_G00029580 [Alosa alosa]
MFPFRLKMPTFNWKKSRRGDLNKRKDSPAKTSSSRVQANETLSELRETPAGPLEMPQEEKTGGAVSSGSLSFQILPQENNSVPGCATSSHEIQLDKATAELTASEGQTKPEETVSGLDNTSSLEMWPSHTAV